MVMPLFYILIDRSVTQGPQLVNLLLVLSPDSPTCSSPRLSFMWMLCSGQLSPTHRPLFHFCPPLRPVTNQVFFFFLENSILLKQKLVSVFHLA